ncbi:MAG: hypothetical protein GX876_05990, partial [Bacteroidales bacterium]|nr:hypothetical protein [Bacteroidales bacterium]
MKKLKKYSIGMGDRFGHQGSAQLAAIIEAEKKGIDITPVWNKSNREHIIIGTRPEDVRKEADEVTRKAGFNRPYFVDADHINLDNVDKFIVSSDFFTIDVASYIGRKADKESIRRFVSSCSGYTGELKIEGLKPYPVVSESQILSFTEKYLFAAQKAGEIYRKIKAQKGKDNFVAEVSMDEVPSPQTPVELFFILKMLGEEQIPAQTIAPKFSGRFNKGVDYAGDPLRFAAEFEADIMVIDMAVKEFGLPGNLKMSVHSGSDKFAIYPHIGSIIRKHDKGLHLKTAGTTWLEEVIGLAESGGEALEFVRKIYADALGDIEKLCAPYADVIDIDTGALPSWDEVADWNNSRFAGALRHVPGNPDYNPDMRQLI